MTNRLTHKFPWLETTLPKMLARDFNKIGKGDIKKLIRGIKKQRKKNFEASFDLIDWSEWAKL